MSRNAIHGTSRAIPPRSAAGANTFRAALLTCALSLSVLAPSPALAGAAHDVPADVPAAAPNCSPLRNLLATARRMGEVGEVETVLYVGVPGEALLEAFNRETSAEAAGAGLFVARIPGVDEVMVGIIAPDHSMVCGGRIMTNDAWSALETNALGREVRLAPTISDAATG